MCMMLATSIAASANVVVAPNPIVAKTPKPAVATANLKIPKAPAKPTPKAVPAASPQPLSGLALQWLQEKCPNLLQPYELTGNVSELVGADSWLQRHNPLNKLEGLQNLKKLGDLLNGDPQTVAAAPPPPEAAVPVKEDLKVKVRRLNWLPMQAELIYGEREHKEEDEILDPDTEIGERLYPRATAMLAEVTRSMDEILEATHQTSPYDFKLFILKRDQHNAVARPGGYIYIDAGLLEDDPALSAKAHFALAHEVAHILRRHETFELQSLVVDSFAAERDLRLALISMNRKPASVLEHIKVDKGIYIRHHIDQELQADACGARLLAGVYPTSNALAESIHAFLNELPKESLQPKTANTAAITSAATTNAAQQTVAVAAVSYDIVKTPLDQHPNSEERRQRLESAYEEIVRNGHSSHLAAEK